jgi:hypothetical protein
MMKMKWLITAAALTMLISGCTAAPSEEQANPGAVEQPADPGTEEETNGAEPSGEEAPAEGEADEPAQETGEGGPAGDSLSVIKGETKEIDTMIEGMTEKVEVTEFTLMPYDIRYQLRSRFGEPKMENGQAVYTDTMGTIALEVKPGVSLEDAVSQAQANYADGYEAGEPMDIAADVNSFPGVMQYFHKGNEAYGYKVYDIGGNALVITFSYPLEAGDGMAAVLHELETSIAPAK